MLRFIPYSLVSHMGRTLQYVSLCTIQSGIACGPQFVTFYTIQSGNAYGLQFARRFVRYHAVSIGAHSLLRYQVGPTCDPQVCNTFVKVCNTFKFVIRSVVYHAVWYRWWPTIRYVLYHTGWSLVGRKLQYVPLDTTQSGIARWSQSQGVSICTIQSGTACGQQLAWYANM